MITTEITKQLFHDCEEAVRPYLDDSSSKHSQMFRGVTTDMWEGSYPGNCDRHMFVFKNYNIIPKYCFSCFKIQVSPRNVVELFKLMIIFTGLGLPSDNTRKCTVETRKGIPGTYKGLIYCQSLEEAREVYHFISKLVSVQISPGIPVSIKRGCSEYAIAYPEYNQFDDSGYPLMQYPQEWQQQETYIEENQLTSQFDNLSCIPNKHEGYNLDDVRIMLYWLRYAMTIGDPSYKEITSLNLTKLHKLEPREPFQENV